MKKFSLFFVLAFVFTFVNFAFGQCVITGDFSKTQRMGAYQVATHPIKLNKAKPFRAELKMSNLDGEGAAYEFMLLKGSSVSDPSEYRLQPFRVFGGRIYEKQYHSDSVDRELYPESVVQKSSERKLGSIEYDMIALTFYSINYTVKGKYTITVFNEGCNTNGSAGSSGSSNSGSGNNSSGSNNSGSNNSNTNGTPTTKTPKPGQVYENLETGCSFKGNFKTEQKNGKANFVKYFGFSVNGPFQIETRLWVKNRNTIERAHYWGFEVTENGRNIWKNEILSGYFKPGGENDFVRTKGDDSTIQADKNGDRIRSKQINETNWNVLKFGIGSNEGDYSEGNYEIRIVGGGCGGSVSSGGSSNDSGSNNSSSNKPKNSGSSDNDGSIDIGRVILDKIRENRDKNKKPKDNSGGNNSNSGNNNSNNFGDGVTIFEGKNQSGKSATFGVGTYRADFGPIKTIGNDTASSITVENGYRVKICQNEGSNNQGSGNCEEYGAGNYNLKHDNQASWIKVWKDGKSSNNSNNAPQNDVPYDPNNQINIKLVLFNSKKVSNADCLEGFEEVTTSITKRPSMLRATLEELINYPKSQRGYLNYVKNVSLEDVKIESGVALIYLSGSLGDDCNHNRILFQLGRTARQFPTVKSMRIFLNNKEVGYR